MSRTIFNDLQKPRKPNFLGMPKMEQEKKFLFHLGRFLFHLGVLCSTDNFYKWNKTTVLGRSCSTPLFHPFSVYMFREELKQGISENISGQNAVVQFDEVEQEKYSLFHLFFN